MKHVENNRQKNLSISFTDKDLCTRCGTCVGICPVEALRMGDQYYPVLDEKKCTDCGLCGRVCPGGEVNFPELSRQIFGEEPNFTDYLGYFRDIYVGYGTDESIRARASGGGVVTQLLLYLLKKNEIDGAIVVQWDEKYPCSAIPVIVKTRDELLKSTQSKYTIVPVNKIFSELRKLQGQFALVGLPCHVHGFRKLAQVDKKLAGKIKVVIGLYCITNLEPEATMDLLRIKKIPLDDIKSFEYRGGKWPGQIRVTKKDGAIVNLHYSNYKDGAFNYLTRLYSPKRCQICVDGSAELADISVADAWTRNSNGKYLYKDCSMILVRTEKGQSLIEAAAKDYKIFLKPISVETAYRTHRSLEQQKKKNVPLRIKRWKRKNINIPDYFVKFSKLSLIDRLKEWRASFALLFGRSKFLRYWILRILLSPVGIPVIKIRQFWKSKRY